MEPVIVLIVAGAVIIVVLELYGQRRVAAGHGRFVWLMNGHLLVGAGAILWAGFHLLGISPIVGVVMLAAGVAYVGILLRFLSRASRSVSSAGATGDRSAAIEPAVDFTLTMVGLMLLGGVVAVVVLIVWGVSQAAR